jgi:ribose 5-phosphate isomerase A
LPTWRERADGTRFVTDQQHFIVDLHLKKIQQAEALAVQLSTMTGLVEHGLFLNLARKVIIGSENGSVKILQK